MLVDLPIGPLSLADYFALELPEGVLTELVDGQVVVNPAPAGPHQRLCLRLAAVLDRACPPAYEAVVSPIDWVLWAEPRPTVRMPDVAVVRAEQVDGPRLTEAPLLAVEVLSPGSVERDLVAKRHEYARAGLDHYWVARPDTGEIVRYRRDRGELVEVGRLAAGTRSVVTEPFAIVLDPADLIGHRRPGGTAPAGR